MRQLRIPPLMAASVWAFALAGCTNLEPAFFRSPLEDLSEKHLKEQVHSEAAAATCVVEFRSKAKVSQKVPVPIREGMCVQQVIEASNALRQFSRFDVELARRTPQGAWHKMRVTFDHSANRVDPGYDYAIRPGDYLIVTEDPTTPLDRVLQSMTGNLGNASFLGL